MIARGLLIGVSGGLLGAYMGAGKTTKLSPAEAMRPNSPKVSSFDILRFLPSAKYILNTGGHMAVRNVTRNPFRSAFTVIGVTFAFGILSFIGSLPSVIDSIVQNQFTKVQLYDAKISYKTPVSYTKALEEAYAIKGVTKAEGMFEMTAELNHENLRTNLLITGVDEHSELYKIYDDKKKLSLPPTKSGAIASSGLAEELNIKKGDYITVKSPFLDEDTKIVVMSVVTQELGSSLYMERSDLADLFQLPSGITSVVLKTDDISYLRDYVLNAKNVGVVEDKNDILDGFNSLLGFFNYIFGFLMVMGTIIAVAIIFNTATISLSERQREFTTLRVLGMQISQVADILGFETWLLSIFGMLLGVPFAMFLKQEMANSIDLGTFKFPSYMPAYAYLVGFAGCVIAILVSNRAAKKKIGGFEMVEVLKERE